MLVGNEFYGNRKAFIAGATPEENKNEEVELIRKMTLTAEGKGVDENKEAHASDWSCSNYSAVMNGSDDTEIGVRIKSAGGNESIML